MGHETDFPCEREEEWLPEPPSLKRASTRFKERTSAASGKDMAKIGHFGGAKA